jgi:hypothetical protein
MAAMYDDYLGLDSDYTYSIYQPFIAPTFSTTVVTGDVAPVTVINGGGGGQATGPNVTFSGGATGLQFTAAGNTISLDGTLNVASGGTGASTAAAARTNLGAAESGNNNDITMLLALAGSAGWTLPTGTGSKVGFDTATVTLTQLAEAVKALLDTLAGQGIVQT